MCCPSLHHVLVKPKEVPIVSTKYYKKVLPFQKSSRAFALCYVSNTSQKMKLMDQYFVGRQNTAAINGESRHSFLFINKS